MTSDRIKEIQQATAYPESVSVKQALLQVWNECSQERMYSEEDMRKAIFQAFLLGVDRGTYSKEFEDKIINKLKKEDK